MSCSRFAGFWGKMVGGSVVVLLLLGGTSLARAQETQTVSIARALVPIGGQEPHRVSAKPACNLPPGVNISVIALSPLNFSQDFPLLQGEQRQVTHDSPQAGKALVCVRRQSNFGNLTVTVTLPDALDQQAGGGAVEYDGGIYANRYEDNPSGASEKQSTFGPPFILPRWLLGKYFSMYIYLDGTVYAEMADPAGIYDRPILIEATFEH